MSQYGSLPPPGAYVPPNQGAPAQGFQNPPASPYQSVVSSYGVPGHKHKAGGAFEQMGQMMNQAVTSGKPMLNKLGKTISSRLGNKPAGAPQHLHSYQNFQEPPGQHTQSQAYQQQPIQSFSPQPQQQPWGQPQTQQQPQAPNAFVSPQQSPYLQSNYATPVSNHSGQSNYFPQQLNQAPNSQPQTPRPPPNVPSYNATQFEQSGSTVEQLQAQQGQLGQGRLMQSPPQAPFQQEQQLQGQYTGQQTDAIGMQNPPHAQNIQSPHMSNIPAEMPAQPAQSQWGGPKPGTELPSPSLQQQSGNPLNPAQPYHPVQSFPTQQDQHQQWNGMVPLNSPGQGQGQVHPYSVSPPPHQMNMSLHIPSNKPLQSSQPPTPVSQHAAPQSAPTEFIAELPADMANLTVMESKLRGSDPSTPASQYQAYHPSGSQAGSPSPGFTIPRRTVSASSSPLADPWRIADPVTELPTREFYILADLLFDALDRRFTPRHTGLLEAPKILGSWLKLTEDARQLFSYQSYGALGKMWSLEGIPHIMVPCQSSLTPNWNFSPHSHAEDLKLLAEPPTSMSGYATYMPALNRAGWYRFFFLEMLHSPEDLSDLMPALCSDTYKPGVLNHPDLNKRDRSGIPTLQAKAAQIQTYSFDRACEETRSAMAVEFDKIPGNRPITLTTI